MKKTITLILSLIIVFSTAYMPTLNVQAAGCNHRYSTNSDIYRSIDGRKHSRIRVCTKCGYQNVLTANHIKGNQVLETSSLNDRQHVVRYNCKKCDGAYEVKTNHRYSSNASYEKVDNTYHYKIQTCTCGYKKKTLVKHNTKSGSCTYCGHKNSEGLGGATKRGNGTCAWLISKSLNDNWIYSNCPGCGSTSASFYRRKVIRKNVSVVGGGRVTIYHQQVKCNNCGKKYWNKCYYENQ